MEIGPFAPLLATVVWPKSQPQKLCSQYRHRRVCTDSAKCNPLLLRHHRNRSCDRLRIRSHTKASHRSCYECDTQLRRACCINWILNQNVANKLTVCWTRQQHYVNRRIRSLPPMQSFKLSSKTCTQCQPRLHKQAPASSLTVALRFYEIFGNLFKKPRHMQMR